METKRIKVSGSFSHVSSSVKHRKATGVHDGKDSLASLNKGSIPNQIARRTEPATSRHSLVEPVFDDSLNRTHTVPALSGYLSQSVALDHPAFEPDPLTSLLVDSVLPDKRATTPPTTPALF